MSTQSINLQNVLGRVERRLLATGQTANGASLKAGEMAGLQTATPHMIPNLKKAIKNGRKSVNANWFALMAPALKTSEMWLMFGDGPEESNEGSGPARTNQSVINEKQVAAFSEVIATFLGGADIRLQDEWSEIAPLILKYVLDPDLNNQDRGRLLKEVDLRGQIMKVRST